jgi:hypothetical protein
LLLLLLLLLLPAPVVPRLPPRNRVDAKGSVTECRLLPPRAWPRGDTAARLGAPRQPSPPLPLKSWRPPSSLPSVQLPPHSVAAKAAAAACAADKGAPAADEATQRNGTAATAGGEGGAAAADKPPGKP